MGCWREQEFVAKQTPAHGMRKADEDASSFNVYLKGEIVGEVNWNLVGEQHA